MIEEAIEDFGGLLREHRLAAGLTQEALAERAGVGVRSLQALERGESKPLQDTLRRLAAALRLAPEERALFVATAGPAPRRRTPTAPSPTELPPDDRWRREQPGVRAGLPGALPVHFTSFVGREQEMREVAGLLEGARLLTLTGPGGTGKTRLAVQVAAAVRDQFHDDVAFVSLASIGEPSEVAAAIVTGLGVHQGDDPSPAHALVAYLGARRSLLVLDNFEQVVAAAPLVAGLLAGCPALKIVVTSRMPLHLSGEQEYAVSPLPVPSDDELLARDPALVGRSPAVALFVQRAQLVRPEFALTEENSQAVVDICRRLDGLPLALELAAARIKVLAPSTLLARLGAKLQVLQGGPQDVPARQQTLRGTMDWSYELLDTSEQVLFRRLAVFAGGWTLESAEAVCECDNQGINVLDTLGSLVDQSLLTVEAGAGDEVRYGILETIRAYALERLAACGEVEELQRRHAAYYRRLATLAAPAPGRWHDADWLDWTEHEEDNLRAALNWAHERGEVELEMRLMVPLIGFWYSCRRMRDAQDQLERLHYMQDRHRGSMPPDLQIRALGALASSLWKLGEYERAETMMEECLAHCADPALAPYTLSSLQLLGHITCEKGDYPRATELNREMLRRAREASDTEGVMRALLGLSDVARGQGDAEQVVAHCEECLPLCREIGDWMAEGYVIHNLGVAALLQNDLAGADALLGSSLALFREHEAPHCVAEALTSVGRMARAAGRLEEARSAFVESLRKMPSGPFFLIADDLEGLAGVAAAQRDAERAAVLFGAAHALRREKRMLPSAMRWARLDGDQAAARALLGDDAFEAAYRCGQAMRQDDAVALALELPAVIPERHPRTGTNRLP